MPIPVALIAGAAIGAGQMAYGASLKKKAAQAAAANMRPEYEIAPEEQQMLTQAETLAGTGMSAAAREALRQNSDRALGTGIDAITRGGGNVNAIGSMVAGQQQGLNQMALYEDSARLQHLKNLQEARARMSSNRDKMYKINEYDPWANRAAAINQQQQAAQQTFNSGLNTLGMGALSALQNMPARQPQAPGYIPQQQGMSQLPLAVNEASPAVYTPPPTSVPEYTPQGQPFGMWKDPFGDGSAKWNGYSWEY